MSSSKKIIKLSKEDTLKYLALQIIDIFHDAENSRIVATQNNRRVITEMLAFWLHRNNNSINALIGFDEFHQMILANVERFMGDKSASADIAALIMGDCVYAANDYVVRDFDTFDEIPDVEIIADQCNPKSKTGIFCINKGRFITFGQSVVYDNGAYMNTCGGKKKTKSFNIGTPTSDFKYYRQNNVIDMFNNLVVNDCQGVALRNIRDYAIVGEFQIGTASVAGTLAYMGISTCSEPAMTFFGTQIIESLVFSHRALTSFIRRGTAPSNAMMGDLFRDISVRGNISNNLTNEEMILAYTELAAKHWGDLGMICEAIDTRLYIRSNDQAIKYLCSFFGINYMDDNKLYTKTATTRRPSVVYEDNSPSLF